MTGLNFSFAPQPRVNESPAHGFLDASRVVVIGDAVAESLNVGDEGFLVFRRGEEVAEGDWVCVSFAALPRHYFLAQVERDGWLRWDSPEDSFRVLRFSPDSWDFVTVRGKLVRSEPPFSLDNVHPHVPLN